MLGEHGKSVCVERSSGVVARNEWHIVEWINLLILDHQGIRCFVCGI